MAIDVLEHIKNYFGFLRNCRRRDLYGISYSSGFRSNRFTGSPLMKDGLTIRHIHYFTKDMTLTTLGDTGYEIGDYFYTNGFELPKRGGKPALLKAPRKMLFPIKLHLAARFFGGFFLMFLQGK